MSGCVDEGVLGVTEVNICSGARSLHFAPVLSSESTGAPVEITRVCLRALSLDSRCLMLDSHRQAKDFIFAGGH